MKLTQLKGLLYLCCLCVMPVISSAQENTSSRTHVDTLSIAERLSIRTNMVDWTLLVPNIGVEFDIKSENWNRWTVGLNLRNNWQTSNTFKPGMVYNLRGVRAEFRNYWRPRQISEQYPAHTKLLDKLFSCRRTTVKHPGVVFYRGAYVSYNDFSIKLSSKGYQGQAYTFGFTYGMVKPLYVFKSGSSLDLELGVSAGISYARYDEYRHDRESNCYPVTKVGTPTIVLPPTVSDLRVGFVYRIGKYPLSKKYQWRYDVDTRYKEMCDSIAGALERERQDNKLRDSLTENARTDFWHVYDSVMVIKNHHADSINKVKAEQEAIAAKLLREAKEKERQAKLDAKAAEKKQKDQPADSTAVPVAAPAAEPAHTDSTAVPVAAPEAEPAQTDSTAVSVAEPEAEAAQTDSTAVSVAEPEAEPEQTDSTAVAEPAEDGVEPSDDAEASAEDTAEPAAATEESAEQDTADGQESEAPAEETSPAEASEETPSAETSSEETPSTETSSEETPSAETLSEETPSAEASEEATAVSDDSAATDTTVDEQAPTQDINEEEEGKEADNED